MDNQEQVITMDDVIISLLLVLLVIFCTWAAFGLFVSLFAIGEE